MRRPIKYPMCYTPRCLEAGMRALGLALLIGCLLPSAASAANWNCRKGLDGKWVCNSPKPEGGAENQPEQSSAPSESKPSPATKPSRARAAAPSAPRPPSSEAEGAEPAGQETETTSAGASPLQPESAPGDGAVPPVASDSSPAPSKSGKNGWSCRSASAKKGWNCALSGPDPKGKTHVASKTPGKAAKAASPYAFTGLEESRFREMLAVVGRDPWAASCAGLPPAFPSSSSGADPSTLPLETASDYLESEGDEIYTFTGKVDMARGDQRLLGDYVVHDKFAHTLNAHGNVVYKDSGVTVASDSLFMKLDTNEGKLRNAQYLFEELPARGKAETTYFDGKDHSRYIKASFTTCPPGNNDWLIHASRLRVDKSTGRGVASNAWLEFKGVPVFYTPSISFPTDKRRQTGFLAPNFGFSSNMGFSTTLPYYWNIAPNYDLTLYPRYNVKRGFVMGGDLRYMQEGVLGDLQGQFMPDDQIRNQQRGFASFTERRTLLPSLSSAIKLNYVSDNRYLAEMWNSIYQHGSLNQSYLPSTATLSYGDSFGNVDVHSKLSAANYQILADNFPDINKPYRTLPSWSFGGSVPIGLAEGIFSLNNEVAHFDHSAAPLVNRVNIKPSLSFPWQNSWGFLTPKATLQQTQYWVDDSSAVISSPISSASRTTPIGSVDAGLRFDRETSLFGSDYTHTLEPRLFYVYLPYSNQDNLPIIGSAPYDFTFSSLFRENRFSGIDRMGDANQVSAAVTTRLIDNASGREKLHFSLGKLVDLTDPKVQLVNPRLFTGVGGRYLVSQTGYRPSRSDVIADASAAITDTVKISPLVIWNYEDNRADRFQITTHYDGGGNKLFNVGYRYRYSPDSYANVPDNTDVSFSWPIANEWSVVGRWQYAWRFKKNLETYFGVQRETCCWRFGIIAREYMTGVAISDPNQTTQTAAASTTQGVFLSLELKGFAHVGDSIGHFLMYSIPGYEADVVRNP